MNGGILEVIKMIFDLNGIKVSYKDISERRKFPEGPSCKLAELLGALAGDGHVAYHPKGNDYIIEISGHAQDDLDYLHYLKGLIKDLFNIEMNVRIRDSINTAYVFKRSLGIFSFLERIGYQKRKCVVKTPEWIWSDKSFAISFIRGLFDTDGSLA